MLWSVNKTTALVYWGCCAVLAFPSTMFCLLAKEFSLVSPNHNTFFYVFAVLHCLWLNANGTSSDLFFNKVISFSYSSIDQISGDLELLHRHNGSIDSFFNALNAKTVRSDKWLGLDRNTVESYPLFLENGQQSIHSSTSMTMF